MSASQQGDLLVPELPDIVVYIEALEKRILGKRLDRVRIASPFLLRTAAPPLRDRGGQDGRHIAPVGQTNLHRLARR